MYCTSLNLFFVLFFKIATSVNAIGVVTVGFNATTPLSQYVFTENSNSPKIRVILSESTGATLSFGGVTISCHLENEEPTAAPFTKATIANKNAAASVDMDVVFQQSGRPVKFYCKATGNTQFNDVKSNVFTLQRKKAPTVSICSPVTDVSRTALTGNLRVMMSDVVVNSNVQVACGAKETATEFLKVTVNPSPVTVGNGGVTKRTSIAYSVTAQGKDNTLACTGKSVDNVQYRTANSEGSATRMTLSPATLVLVPDQLRTSSQSVQLLLTLGTPPVRPNKAVFLCSVVRIDNNIDEAAQMASPACNTSTPLSSTNTTNGTASWSVTARLEVPGGESSLPVTLTRSSASMTAVTERLLVSCCSNPADTSSIYFGVAAVAKITAAFPGMVPVNGSGSGTASQETQLPNPAFVDVAPCPCDLTSNICDEGCCCDSICTAQNKLLKPCLTGHFGGDLTTLPEKPHRCSIPPVNRTEDYAGLMCIMFENNAVLGQFYETPSALSNEDTTAKVTAAASQYQFKSQGVSDSVTSTANPYKSGRPVLIIRNEGNADSTDQAESLTLPGPVFKGICSRDRTVRFLENRQSSCDLLVTNTCPASLSARSYLVGSGLTHPACPVYPSVLSAGGTNNRVPTEVEYYCVTDDTALIGTYIKSSTASSASLSTSTTTGLSNLVECVTFASNHSVLCNRQQRVSDAALAAAGALKYTRCSFDDGYSLPPTPTFNTGTKKCDNAVINVSYAFAWNETSITALRVFVLMSSVPVQRTLSQAFKVNFTSGSSALATQTEINQKSGVFGYDEGKPLIGGLRVDSGSYVDANRTRWPFMLKPDFEGRCDNARTEPILFPFESDSSCRIYLKMSDFDDCLQLRGNLAAYMDQLTPFNVLATYGDPNNQAANDWANVYANASFDLFPNVTNATTTSNSTTSDSKTTSDKFGNFFSGRCQYIPMGVRMKIIYATQGKARDNPIRQIIGARKEYITQDIQLNCDNSFDSPCTDKSLGQQFFIELKYNFKEVPATWNTDIYGLYKRGGECWWDICMEDVFSPWTTPFFQAIRKEIIGYTLIIFLVAVPVLFAAWPW